MTDTPRVPLQGNIIISRVAPSVETSDGKIIVIADHDDLITIIDDSADESVITAVQIGGSSSTSIATGAKARKAYRVRKVHKAYRAYRAYRVHKV